jgi:hypothetical protein
VDDEEFLKGMDYRKAGLKGKALGEFRKLPATVRGEMIALCMRQARDDEPEPVTERMRPLRLIGQMQEERELDAETVDAIIAEGQTIGPLLVGVMRAWAQDFLDEGGDDDLENALALLGETGAPAEIPHLLEFIGQENETASGASSWALGRIVERHLEESAKFLESIAGGMEMAQRLSVAELTLRYPEFDPAGRLLERLSENLDSMAKDDRDAFFPLLLATMATARGRAGVSLGRAALRRLGGLLSRSTRRECEEMLTIYAEEGIPRAPAKRSSLTVYDICAGQATWDNEEEMEDELLPPEPVRRRATPGRNDPCWCNSGKKYKKCHLDSDERESRRPE